MEKKTLDFSGLGSLGKAQSEEMKGWLRPPAGASEWEQPESSLIITCYNFSHYPTSLPAFSH